MQVSPRPSVATHHSSLQISAADMAANRPAIMKRQSSQSSHGSKAGALSPGSLGEGQPLRPVKPAKKTKIVLPRGHGSGRNLVRLAQQAQTSHAADQARKNSTDKPRSQETEIRLPGSLDEKRPQRLRRNFTATQLPRNPSHTKLKKNLSHGQLTRLAHQATTTKGPPSPGLKGRNKRPKSADMSGATQDIHEQDVNLAHQREGKKDAPKTVAFAVGSDGGEAEDLPQMEGSGLQEDEWTDQSASVSPYSTRQNTANNSRRASVTADKPPEKPVASRDGIQARDHAQNSQKPAGTQVYSASEESDESNESDEDGKGLVHGQAHEQQEEHEAEQEQEQQQQEQDDSEPQSPRSKPSVAHRDIPPEPAPPVAEAKEPQQARLRSTKEHPNPATRHLMNRNSYSPAPALVSNVSALDESHVNRASPAPSMESSRSNIIGEAAYQEDELVSRFVPSASHPSTASGATTAANTPKTRSLHTPENESALTAQRRDKSSTGFGIGPVSPTSTRSASSGINTPALSRFRNEEKMMNEKAVAEMEDAAERAPLWPPHVFDRRNESLKSYLNLSSLGGDGKGGLSASKAAMSPDMFAGRFKAVNTELKVVQRFRDPLAESISRLYLAKDSNFSQIRSKKAPSQKQLGKMPISKSAVSLPKQASKLSTSASPPQSASPVKPSILSAKSATQIKRSDSRRSKVTFSQPGLEAREVAEEEDGKNADAIAKQLWESIVPPT